MFQIEVYCDGAWVALDEADNGVDALAKAQEFVSSMGGVVRVSLWGETWI